MKTPLEMAYEIIEGFQTTGQMRAEGKVTIMLAQAVIKLEEDHGKLWLDYIERKQELEKCHAALLIQSSFLKEAEKLILSAGDSLESGLSLNMKSWITRYRGVNNDGQ
jgi:hypothetical protein